VRSTEWRDCTTGATIARELYDHAADPAERTNRIDDPAIAAERETAAGLLAARFPPAPRAAAAPPAAGHETPTRGVRPAR